MTLAPFALSGGILALFLGFLAGWTAGARAAYRHGFEDALEWCELAEPLCPAPTHTPQ